MIKDNFYDELQSYLSNKGDLKKYPALYSIIKDKNTRKDFNNLIEKCVNRQDNKDVLSSPLSINDISAILSLNNRNNGAFYEDTIYSIGKDMELDFLRPVSVINPFKSSREILNYIDEISVSDKKDIHYLNLIKFIPLNELHFSAILSHSPSLIDGALKDFFLNEKSLFEYYRKYKNASPTATPRFIMNDHNLKYIVENFSQQLEFAPCVFQKSISMGEFETFSSDKKYIENIFLNTNLNFTLMSLPIAKETFLENLVPEASYLYPDITNEYIDAILDEVDLKNNFDVSLVYKLNNIIHYGHLSQEKLSQLTKVLCDRFAGVQNKSSILLRLSQKLNNNVSPDIIEKVLKVLMLDKDGMYSCDGMELFFDKLGNREVAENFVSVFLEEFVTKTKDIDYTPDNADLFFRRIAISPFLNIENKNIKSSVISLLSYKSPEITAFLLCNPNIPNNLFKNAYPQDIDNQVFDNILNKRFHLLNSFNNISKTIKDDSLCKEFSEKTFSPIMEYIIKSSLFEDFFSYSSSPVLNEIYTETDNSLENHAVLGFSLNNFKAPFIPSHLLSLTTSLVEETSKTCDVTKIPVADFLNDIVYHNKIKSTITNSSLFKYSEKDYSIFEQFGRYDINPHSFNDDKIALIGLPYEVSDIELNINFPFHVLSEKGEEVFKTKLCEFFSLLPETELKTIKNQLLNTFVNKLNVSINKISESGFLVPYNPLSAYAIYSLSTVIDTVSSALKEKELKEELNNDKIAEKTTEDVCL